MREQAMNAGFHATTWDGRDDQGRRLGPGVYFARFTVGGATFTRRVPLIP